MSRGIQSDTRSYDNVQLQFDTATCYAKEIIRIMTTDNDKAKRALDHLQAERQAQQDRLQLAAQAKQQLDADLHAHCQIASAEERFGLR